LTLTETEDLLATMTRAAKVPPKDHRLSDWRAAGCSFLRFDLVPGKGVELNKIFHDEIVILAFKGAAWSAAQNNQTYEERADCLILRDAGQVYSARLEHIDPQGAVCREIHIRPERLREIYDLADDVLPAFDFRRPVIESRPLTELLFRTHELYEEDGCELERSSHLMWLVGAIARETSGRSPRLSAKSCSRRSRMVIDYIRDHFDEKISLPELAELVQINPYVLLRQFRAEIGVTPHDYLQAYRLYRARQFIHGGVRLAEVAVLCGYADQSHFNRQFKQRFGITPGQFSPRLSSVRRSRSVDRVQ
jgi:AraC-like DNA-binding protein